MGKVLNKMRPTSTYIAPKPVLIQEDSQDCQDNNIYYLFIVAFSLLFYAVSGILGVLKNVS